MRNWLTIVLCLLFGGMIFTGACKPPIPDDDASDDDDTATDDDDDDDFDAAITAKAPEGFLGDFLIDNSLDAECEDTDMCHFKLQENGLYQVGFQAWNALFLDKEVNIVEYGQTTEVTWSGTNGDWGLAPFGIYNVYDIPCADVTDGTVPLDSDLQAETKIEEGQIGIYGLGVTYFVTGTEIVSYSGNVTGTISNDLTEIYTTDGSDGYWYCLVE